MEQIKELKIKIRNKNFIAPDIYMTENYAAKVVLDFTNTGTDGKEKYVDVRNTAGATYRYSLGTETIVDFWLTNEITNTAGQLEINPLAQDEIEINGEIRTQNIIFQTYIFNMKESIGALAPGGENIANDLIAEILTRLRVIEDDLGII